MIILAHDGSIYGDWVARYAIGFAAVEADRKLLVLHVAEGKVSEEIVDSRFAGWARSVQSLAIEFLPQVLPLGQSTYRSLRQSVPHDPQALLICGTRVKPRGQNYLSGSVAEQAAAHAPVPGAGAARGPARPARTPPRPAPPPGRTSGRFFTDLAGLQPPDALPAHRLPVPLDVCQSTAPPVPELCP